MTVRDLTFKEAMEIAKEVGIANERTDHRDDTIVLDLNDGSRLRFKSNYDGPYSEITPGNGIEPPTVTYERD